MVMEILNFPKEVQLAIVESLPRCDLLALSVASKGLRRLVEPVIYSSIKMTWTLQHDPRIMLLLRTLLDRSDLGSHVRCLGLEGVGFFKPRSQQCLIPAALPNIVPFTVEQLSRAAERAGLSQEAADSWIHAARSGSADAVVAFLISLLPNLAWLSLSANWTIETKHLGLVFRSALCRAPGDSSTRRLPTYESLKHVSLEPRFNDDRCCTPTNTLDALALFYLPNVEHISVSIDNPIEFSWPSSAPPNPSSLSSLELHRIRETHLEPVLSAIRNLREIRYNWLYQGDIDYHISDEIVRLDKMAAMFARFSDTLTELVIKADVYPAYSAGEYEDSFITIQGSLTQLSQLHKLRRLKVPWAFVMGLTMPSPGRIGAVLPPSVEHLELLPHLVMANDSEWRDELFVSAIKTELESGALSAMGSLKTITLPGSCYSDGTPSECKRELESLGARFNLKLVHPDAAYNKREPGDY